MSLLSSASATPKELYGPLAIGCLLVVYTIWRRVTSSSTHKRLQLTDKNVSLDRQSVLVEGTTDIYQSQLVPNGQYLHVFHPDAQTLYDVFKLGMQRSKDGSCVGWRPTKNAAYVWRTYATLLKQATDFGAGLVHKGVQPGSLLL